MVITSDWEVTTSNNGNPFDVTNKAVCVGWKVEDQPPNVFWEWNNLSFSDARWAVLFNAKFDLHWFKKQGFTLPQRVWCCQLAEFLLEGQKNRYPSLEQAAIKYELGHKVDIVATEYWDKNIDTDAIPKEILKEYTAQDVNLTYEVYLKQCEQFQNNLPLFRLFRLLCLDLLTLQEMEWNGLMFDEVLCKEKETEVANEIQDLKKQLSSIYPDITINFNSGDQLSAFLYGGTITEEYKEHIGFYKTGDKAGQPKYQNKERFHTLPQLVKPLPKTQLKKDGYFKTDEATLRKLKGNKQVKKILSLLLRLSELEKLNSTYYKGIPMINKEMNWPAQELHGQFNQCVAQTGRLSSSKPNQQNFADDCLDILVSRYE